MELIEASIGCPAIYSAGPVFEAVLRLEGGFTVAGTIQAEPMEFVFLEEVF